MLCRSSNLTYDDRYKITTTVNTCLYTVGIPCSDALGWGEGKGGDLLAEILLVSDFRGGRFDDLS